MGPPLHIMNHTKKQYIRLVSCNIDSGEVNEMLPVLLELIKDGRWDVDVDDDIRAKNISGGIEYQQDEYDKYLNWECLHTCE